MIRKVGKSMNEKIQQSDQPGLEERLAETLPEAHIRAQKERTRRERLEKIQQERKKLDDLKQLAEFESAQAELFIEGCKNILKDNLASGLKVEWVSLYNDMPYPPFVFKKPAPRFNQIAREKGVPPKSSFSELLSPAVKKERLQKENDAKNTYTLMLKQYEEEKESQRAAHEKERAAYIAAQSEYNSAVEQLQLDYEKGRPAAVESFARIVLNGINRPDPVTVYFDAVYQPAEKLLVIDALMPSYYDLPRAVSYQYDKGVREITPIEMNNQEFDAFYLDLILQIALIAMDTIFKAIPARHVQWVGFNGLVENDKIEETLETKSCILTCKAARNDFAALDLSQNSPGENFFKLNGLLAKSLSGDDTVPSMIIIEPAPGPDVAERNTDNSITGTKPPEYKPGEFKQVTTKIVEEMLEDLEKNLLNSVRNKDDMIH
jgi:restriction system protein